MFERLMSSLLINIFIIWDINYQWKRCKSKELKMNGYGMETKIISKSVAEMHSSRILNSFL